MPHFLRISADGSPLRPALAAIASALASGCIDGEPESASPIDESDFLAQRAEMICDRRDTCDFDKPYSDTHENCLATLSSPDSYDIHIWTEHCGATYNPEKAAKCLDVWTENGVDCNVPFHTGCEYGDWYDNACDIWEY